MFSVSRFRIALAIPALSASLLGCTMAYPGFDSMLNPDVANPNVGDIADSVRCAVAKFYIDRAAQIRAKALVALAKKLEAAPRDGSFNKDFCKEPTALTDPKWRIAIFAPDLFDGHCRWVPLDRHPPKNLKELFRRWPNKLLRHDENDPYPCGFRFATYRYVDIGDQNRGPRALPGANKNACVPTGGCPPGTSRKFNQTQTTQPVGEGLIVETDELDAKPSTATCILRDDDNKFSLDPTGKAKIELTIQAVNSVSMNYQKIDASNWHNYFIVAGNALNPFPSLKASDKTTNKVEITLTMPQANSVSEKVPTREDVKKKPELESQLDVGFLDNLDALRASQKKWISENTKGSTKYHHWSLPPGADAANVKRKDAESKQLAALMERARAELTADVAQYEKCESRVNFLALSDYLTKIVSERDSADPADRKKGLEASLDTMILTSQFQITLDAAAGTQHLLRIVPVAQPPVLGFSPDHTHTLKLTFAGRKGRAFDNNAKTLIEKCLDRFKGLDLVTSGPIKFEPKGGASATNAQPYAGKEPYAGKKGRRTPTVEEVCNDPRTVLLESLIEAVDNSKSGSSSNP